MLRLPKFFMLPGSYRAAFIAGACNAVDAIQERERWMPEVLMTAHLDRALNDSAEAFDKTRRLMLHHRRRIVKRAVVRFSRLERSYGRAARDRGDHVLGRANARLLRDFTRF